MGTGLQQIPFRIPEKWSAAWYQQHLRDVLALADSRNSIGVGLTVTGDPNTLATYSVDEDIRNLVNETFVLVSLSALTPNARQISADEGVSISDNGPGALLTIGLADHGIPYSKLEELTTFGVLGRAPHIPGGPEEIAASTDGDVLCVQSDALGFTNTPIWTGTHNWLDGVAATWGTDGDLAIAHSGANASIANATGVLAITSAGGFTVNGDTLAEIAQDAVGTILVDSTSIDFTYNDGVPSITASTINANPTATIGLTAVNGTAATPMRSDGAPALSQAITPTWTNTHTFNNTPVVPNDSWTYAKIQNVSATSRVLGRISSGAGDIEELTSANLVTILGSAIPSGANPSASVGLSAVNGSASTFLRSDGAPPINQAISPTWTGQHTFAPASGQALLVNGAAGFSAGAFVGAATVGNSYGLTTVAGTNASDAALRVFDVNVTPLFFVLGNGSVQVRQDNQELQLGAGQDLRLYHDGTNSFIENDTGNLVFKVNGELDLEEVTTSTGTNIPTIGTNKPGSAVSLTPSTWLTLIVNGVTYYLPLWV